jgi:hypothetical protein
MRRALRLALLAALFLFATQACIVVDDDDDVIIDNGDVVLVEDLIVEWSIDGVENATLCDIYGVDIWEVDVVGLDSDVDDALDVDCRTSTWGIAFELPLGTYDVRVGAYDELDDVLIVEETDTITLDDLDNIDPNESYVEFFGADF